MKTGVFARGVYQFCARTFKTREVSQNESTRNTVDFTREKSRYFLRLVLTGRRSPVPKRRDFNLWFPRCMGIKIPSLKPKKYWKPRMKMLVFGPPNTEISDPRVLSVYLMFCTCLTSYFLNPYAQSAHFRRGRSDDRRLAGFGFAQTFKPGSIQASSEGKSFKISCVLSKV